MVVVVGMLYDVVTRLLQELCVHCMALLWNCLGGVFVSQYVVPRDVAECSEWWELHVDELVRWCVGVVCVVMVVLLFFFSRRGCCGCWRWWLVVLE